MNSNEPVKMDVKTFSEDFQFVLYKKQSFDFKILEM